MDDINRAGSVLRNNHFALVSTIKEMVPEMTAALWGEGLITTYVQSKAMSIGYLSNFERAGILLEGVWNTVVPSPDRINTFVAILRQLHPDKENCLLAMNLEKEMKTEATNQPGADLEAQPKPNMPPCPDTDAIDEAKLGSVRISYHKEEYYYVDKTFKIGEPTTCGSGFVVDNEYILTNAHVVRNTDIVDIKLNSEEIVRGNVTDVDELADLAIVKFKLHEGTSIPPLVFADSNSVTVMQAVAAIGSPWGPMNSITTGTVTHLLRKYNDLGLPQDTDLKYFETDATILHGNSGGPLLNLAGKVIGVVSTRFDTHKSFAIKSNDAEKFVKTAKKEVTRYTIGVTMLTPDKGERPAILEHFLLPKETKGGVVLMEVKKDSPASRAGLKREDFVFSINGQPISSAHDVYKMVRRGEPLNIQFYRIQYVSGGLFKKDYKNREDMSVRVTPMEISDLQA